MNCGEHASCKHDFWKPNTCTVLAISIAIALFIFCYQNLLIMGFFLGSLVFIYTFAINWLMGKEHFCYRCVWHSSFKYICLFCLLRLLRPGWEQSSMVNLISLREVSCLLKRLWLGRWLASEEYSVLSQSTYYCLLIDFVLLCLPTKFLTLGWLYWFCNVKDLLLLHVVVLVS